jgi:hypothetical protein
MRLLKLSGEQFVRAVSGYTSSQAAATDLVQARLARSAAAG